ncbi:MAG: hypothetical protein ACLULK_05210 [Anaerovoracaceae bacterium]
MDNWHCGIVEICMAEAGMMLSYSCGEYFRLNMLTAILVQAAYSLANGM